MKKHIDIIREENGPLVVSLRKKELILSCAIDELDFLVGYDNVPDYLTLEKLKELIIDKCIESIKDFIEKYPEKAYYAPDEKEIIEVIEVTFTKSIFEEFK